MFYILKTQCKKKIQKYINMSRITLLYCPIVGQDIFINLINLVFPKHKLNVLTNLCGLYGLTQLE